MNTIKLHCTDNDKIVDAEVVNESDEWITAVMQPGAVKVTLKRSKPNLYVGSLHGYEFVYKLDQHGQV